MDNTIVVLVGLVLLSVAAPAVPVGGNEGDSTPVRALGGPSGDGDGPAVSGAPAAPGRGNRLLALPGVDAVDAPLIVAAGGLLGLLFAGGVLLLGRRRGSAADRQPAGGEGGSNAERDERPSTSGTPPSDRNRARGGPKRTVRTDEEYVVQLLIANNGRMKQARIVEETDWSKAKVSRLLSRMEERGQVVRERAGREKIVQLADANSSIPL